MKNLKLLQLLESVLGKGKSTSGNNIAFFSPFISHYKPKLEIDINKVNLDGGAISLGHPLGATGARITGKAAELLVRENKKYALATQCIGYGMGIATIIESTN